MDLSADVVEEQAKALAKSSEKLEENSATARKVAVLN
jgi:hypothetical protein